MYRVKFIVHEKKGENGPYYIAEIVTKAPNKRLKPADFKKLNQKIQQLGSVGYYKLEKGFKFYENPGKKLDHIDIKLTETYRPIGRPKKMQQGGIIQTSDGTKGGKLKGKTHAKGGIKAIVTDTQKPVELENGEAIIKKEAVESHKTYEFEGQKLSPQEILSRINQDAGGVPIMKKGGNIDENKTYKTEAKEHMHTFEKIKRHQIKTPDDLGKSIAYDHRHEYKKGGKLNENELKYNSIPKKIKEFMPPMQQSIVNSNIEEFQDALQNLENQIDSLPRLYGTQKIKDPIIWLHYFYGASDWYVIENDSTPEKYQCFGYVVLNDDLVNAELGYINVEELKESDKVELDFYWKPVKLSVIKKGENDESEEFETNDEIEETEQLQDLSLNKKQEQITTEIRALIDKNGLDFTKYTPSELQYLRKYEGLGSLANSSYVKSLDIHQKVNILDQFFTPDIVIKYMWALAFKFGFNFKVKRNILEPSVGIGRFLEYIPEDQNVDAFDIDYYSYVITKLSFPGFNIKHASMETLFFQGKHRIGISNVSKKYDLVIGNPPYREYNSEYSKIKGSASYSNENTKGNTEKEVTKAYTFDQYMIARGVDLLNYGGLLVFIVPNSFLSNEAKYNDFKEQLYSKAELLTAYRLPNGIFNNTEIGTDIIVLKKK